MNLFRALRGNSEARSAPAGLDFNEWVGYFTHNGLNYPFIQNGSISNPTQEIGGDYQGLIEGAYKSNGVVFACMLARQLLFSEARFQFRQIRSGRLGELYGTQALRPLERPWANATTGDLLARVIQDADLAGNSYTHRAPGGILQRWRPDWVTIVLASETQPENPASAADCEVVGYVYTPGGIGGTGDPIFRTANEVAHFAPIPDPACRFRGMSWLQPIVSEVMADQAMTTHKRLFIENGATPNMIVTAHEGLKDQAKFDLWVEKMSQKVRGLRDAYKTLYLAHGADAKVVGADLKQVDFKVVQGHGETRVCAAARIPPIVVGLSEGLEAATYSNYGQARRAFADGTMRPLWRNVAGSFETIIPTPSDSMLWYDDRDIPFLQEDKADEANIQMVNAATMSTLVNAGYTPESVKLAVLSGDMGRLQHTGLFSVQLQKPGTETPAPAPKPAVDAVNDTMRLLAALASKN